MANPQTPNYTHYHKSPQIATVVIVSTSPTKLINTPNIGSGVRTIKSSSKLAIEK